MSRHSCNATSDEAKAKRAVLIRLAALAWLNMTRGDRDAAMDLLGDASSIA